MGIDTNDIQSLATCNRVVGLNRGRVLVLPADPLICRSCTTEHLVCGPARRNRTLSVDQACRLISSVHRIGLVRIGYSCRLADSTRGLAAALVQYACSAEPDRPPRRRGDSLALRSLSVRRSTAGRPCLVRHGVTLRLRMPCPRRKAVSKSTRPLRAGPRRAGYACRGYESCVC